MHSSKHVKRMSRLNNESKNEGIMYKNCMDISDSFGGEKSNVKIN